MKYNLIVIEGPTASGKSALALSLAKQLDTEIISADSRQVYKFLNIGTAKPDSETLSQVKHHLIDIITPDQRYSVGAFVKDARKIIDNLHQQGKIPIVCGGTMLYIKSLLYGLDEIPPIPPDAIQKTKDFMTSRTLAQCYDFVCEIDPKFATQISSTDKQRISRAIEVWYAFNKPLTKFWKHSNFPPTKGAEGGLNPLKILVHRDRADLYARINTRMHQMIKAGLLEEIKSVLEMGYTANDYGLNSVGYKEFICKNNSLPSCIEKAAQHTRNYAKRQLTWYRKEHFDLIYNENDDIIKETTE